MAPHPWLRFCFACDEGVEEEAGGEVSRRGYGWLCWGHEWDVKKMSRRDESFCFFPFFFSRGLLNDGWVGGRHQRQVGLMKQEEVDQRSSFLLLAGRAFSEVGEWARHHTIPVGKIVGRERRGVGRGRFGGRAGGHDAVV